MIIPPSVTVYQDTALEFVLSVPFYHNIDT